MKHEDLSARLHESLIALRLPWWKKVPLGMWVLLAAVVITTILIATRPTVAPIPTQEKSWPVAAVTAQYADIKPMVTMFGQIVAGREVEMRALVAGQVIETGPNFSDGGTVTEGELLIQIDPFDYQAALDDARARQREARARLKSEQDSLVTDEQQLELAKRDYDRAQRLHEKGTVSLKFLDNSELELSRAQQSVTSRRNRIEMEAARLQQHDVVVRRAERDLENATLRAPFTGFVRQINAELGKRVGVNDQLALVSDSERLEVRFNITDAQYGRILAAGEEVVGREVIVTWQVGTQPIEYRATVERVGAKIDAQSGGIDLFAKLDAEPGSVNIRPGAFVEVRFPDRLYNRVVQLPESALFGGTTVYVIEDSRLVAREVTLQGYAGDTIFVGSGIKDGETVLTTRFAGIGEGVLVNIRE